MIRGIRVIRYVVIAFVLLLGVYKISTNNVSLKDYNFTPSSSPKGTTGGLESGADVIPPAENLEDSHAAASAAASNADSTSATGSAAAAPVAYARENATFVTLCRNSDLWHIIPSIRHVEDRFNSKYHYDWVFLNDDDFTEDFKRVVQSHVSGTAVFGKIPPEHWSIPEWIDQDKAALAREKMQEQRIIYGGSLPYRHMCRFESGFFSQNPALDNYKYYWRVEPDTKLFCDVNYDIFKFMRENKKRYGFTISLYEYGATIETLWQTTVEFMKQFPQHVAPNNAMGFISDNNGETYNNCHFWSNFEVGDLDFWRSPAYRDYFNFLDKAGGFFYERWGDAPVHSIAAALFMDQSELHFFEDIGYYHVPFASCPTDPKVRDDLRCVCPNDVSLPEDQRTIFTWHGYSCIPKWYKFTGLERPKGWSEWTD